MDDLDLPQDAFLATDYDQGLQYHYINGMTWAIPPDQPASPGEELDSTTAAAHQIRHHPFHYHHHQRVFMAADWFPEMQQPSPPPPPPQQQQQQQQQQVFQPDPSITTHYHAFSTHMQPPPTHFLDHAQSMPPPQLAMTSNGEQPIMAYSSMESFSPLAYYQNDLHTGLTGHPLNDRLQRPPHTVQNSMLSQSPTDTWTDDNSATGSDSGWQLVEYPSSRPSFESYNEPHPALAVSNPGLTLHIRTSSTSTHSDLPLSAGSFSSFEEIPFPMNSPQSEAAMEFAPGQAMPHVLSSSSLNYDYQQPSPMQSSPSPSSSMERSAMPYVSGSPAGSVEDASMSRHSSSPSTSPTSPVIESPSVTRRRSSPNGKSSKTIAKKPVVTIRKDGSEKRIGRRKGPLRPDQRKQAGEIRKLRACLRCKFLKKTCDKGDPCTGCRPSHTRLWQVPCTRIDIKDIAYFMKDWKADYQRHLTLDFSISNITGFGPVNRELVISHGYGFGIRVQARQVFVRNDECFGTDWVESEHETPREFDFNTAKLCLGEQGISQQALSQYLDLILDNNFEGFVHKHFQGTKFLTEMLITANRYFVKSQLPIIRKALKLVIAYNLTMHITLVEGLSDEDDFEGRIDDEDSSYHGHTLAPVMINFQIKHALGAMWRELQKDVLEELSVCCTSVYSGDKLKNWPTIFMLASILLAVWEEIQFDSHYRTLEPAYVEKFCNDMETTPVGVIVGLFSAISQKIPAFQEWNTQKHHELLGSDPAVCDAMTEVREHVIKHEDYLKSRSKAKFDRDDFDSLSNKFLSKLVIRAA